MQIKKVITVAQAERFCDAYDSIKPSFGKRKHPSEVQSAVGDLTTLISHGFQTRKPRTMIP